MSIDATRWAWRQEVAPTRKLVLLSLADRADEQHACYPYVSRLERDTGLNRETVMSAVRELEQLGLLMVERQKGRGNRYRLVGVEDRHRSGKADYHQYGKADESDKADQSGKADYPSTEKPTTTSTEKPTTTSTEKPTQNRSVEPPREPPKNRPAERLSNRGSRLPVDWRPSAELLQWAKTERPDLNLEGVIEQFKDYWVAKPGKEGLKRDWDATFRRWIRNEHHRQPAQGSKYGSFDERNYGNSTIPSWANEANLPEAR